MLVIQPDPLDPLDLFGEWFAEAGVVSRVVQTFTGEPVPTEVEEDGLLVLGGDMSSLDDAGYPWLEDVRALFRRAAESGQPSLGICLGAQLMSQAFGGSVRLGDQGLEAGVVRVRWTQEAAADPLFHDLADPFPVGAMHGDMIDVLPAGATWLAASALYQHQAFRVGTSSWAVQFHPEIARARYDEWVDDYRGADRAARTRLEDGRDDFTHLEADVLGGAQTIARRFAEILRSAALAPLTDEGLQVPH